MFTNKHVVVALLVAPVLSVLAWFAVGNLIGEKAEPALPGNSYPLAGKSNCRYASGLCELENADITISLRLDESVGTALELTASHPLDAALMSVADPAADPGPRAMQPGGGDGKRWRLLLNGRPAKAERIRLVVSLAGSAYFAEASTAFLQPGDAP